MNIYILHKPRPIWNIALFQTSFEKFLENKQRDKPVIFLPKSKIRTHYHYITGYADPFLFVDGDWLYLFYEEERLKAPASICGLKTKDLQHWQKVGTVLKENFHLSFPFTFRANENIYMIPETREKEAVIMYRATDFPYRWQPITLLEGDKYVDSSVIEHNGVWYLFTSVWYGERNGLHIYYSDRLESGWKEHPMSPLHDDMGKSRCGGAVFEHKGKLYRPAQNCTDYYGENVALFEIELLTPTSFKETKIKDLITKNRQWSKYGGHHFNMVNFKGKTIVAMDGITDDSWINNHTRKFFNIYNRLFNR